MPTEYLPLLSALVVGGCAPLVGIFVVSRRQAFLADALAHVSLLGVATATLFHVAPLPVTLVVVGLVALGLEELSLRQAGLAQEALLATALTGALALANVLLASSGTEAEDLESLLFGSITSVTITDFWVLAGLAAVIVLLLLQYHRQLFLLAFDRDIASASGLSVRFYSRMLAVLVACMVVLISRTIGVLLCGALLVVPALTVRILARNFHQAMGMAVLVGEIGVILGYGVGKMFGFPVESTMVLATIALFGITITFARTR
jgi:zinc transport system permease protein